MKRNTRKKIKFELLLTLKWAFKQHHPYVSRPQLKRYFDKTHRRIKILMVVVLLCLLVGSVRIVTLYSRNSSKFGIINFENITFNTVPLKQIYSRADIVDTNGVVLATSVPVYSVFIKPAHITNPMNFVMQLQAYVPSLPVNKILDAIKKRKPFMWASHSLTYQEKNLLLKSKLKGVYVVPSYKRIYPMGALFSHVVGVVNTYQKGITGLEYGLNKRLIRSNRAVQLTLDNRIQYVVHNELNKAMHTYQAKAAVAIVMDVKTGAIKAMVSLPDFVPHQYAYASNEAKFNRATLGVYELGSVFKIINTALILKYLPKLHMNLHTMIDVSKPLRIGRFTITDDVYGYQKMNIPEILVHSSNIGSAKLAERVGIPLQKQFITQLFQNNLKYLPIPEKGKPIFPHPWKLPELITVAYGHGIAVSLLDFLVVTASMVNEGKRVWPALTYEGMHLSNEQIISPKISHQLQIMLRLTVQYGTGKLANIPGFLIGGKTGTAEKLTIEKTYTSKRLGLNFIGIFPMDKPRYAVYVLIDEPKKAPKGFLHPMASNIPTVVAKHIISRIAPFVNFFPSKNTTEQKKFIGKSKEYAINYIEEK